MTVNWKKGDPAYFTDYLQKPQIRRCFIAASYTTPDNTVVVLRDGQLREVPAKLLYRTHDAATTAFRETLSDLISDCQEELEYSTARMKELLSAVVEQFQQ